jgi:hypothetical protein
MSDATIFVLVFGGLFVLRIFAATVVFFYILPCGDQCPNCDARTARIPTGRWNRLIPTLRSSWCMDCGWEGTLRVAPATKPARHTDRQRLGMQATVASPAVPRGRAVERPPDSPEG